MSEHDELNKLYDAVGNINQDLYDKTGNELLYVSIETNTYATNVVFLDIRIWSSEDEGDRIYDEEKDQLKFFFEDASKMK